MGAPLLLSFDVRLLHTDARMKVCHDVLFEPFIYSNELFAKTGSGQT
eukprot:COSAG06_NODE_6536_length_2891_cov_1.996777_1_plen_47_part_00